MSTLSRLIEDQLREPLYLSAVASRNGLSMPEARVLCQGARFAAAALGTPSSRIHQVVSDALLGMEPGAASPLPGVGLWRAGFQAMARVAGAAAKTSAEALGA